MYGFDDRIKSRGALALYVLQWIGFTIGSIIPIPLIVSASMGLGAAETAAFLQRSLLACGIFSLLQVFFGHRLPLTEGAAGIWGAVTAGTAASAVALGKSTGELMGNIELAMILCGVIVMVMSATGLIEKISRVFTPMLLGTAYIMLPLQFGGTCLVNMFGLSGGGFDGFASMASMLVLLVIVVVKARTRGFINSIAILIGLIAGYLIYLAFGRIEIAAGTEWSLYIPTPFEWGAPSFDFGIFLSQFVVAMVTVVIAVAAIKTVKQTLGQTASKKQISRGVFFNGVSTVFSGLFAAAGSTPFSSCIGFLQITRVAARRAFAIASAAFVVLGLLPPMAALMVSVPKPVVYTIFLIISGSMLGLGVKEYRRLELDTNDVICVSLSLMAGVGVIVLPEGTLSFLPDWCEYIFRNGMAVGIIVCLIAENAMKLIARRPKKESAAD